MLLDGWHMAFENVVGRQDMGTRFPAFFGRVEASGQSYDSSAFHVDDSFGFSSTCFDPFEMLLRTLIYDKQFYIHVICVWSAYNS